FTDFNDRIGSSFSGAFAASDGRNPVPLRAPTKADSLATAGADSTPCAPISCLGTLGPIDESIVNIKRGVNGDGRKDGKHGMETTRKQSGKHTGKRIQRTTYEH